MLSKGPVTKLKEELRAKETEIAELRSLALRTAADFDNARKRWNREVEEIRSYASSIIMKDMIDVWDNFERALSHETAHNSPEELESYRRGVELIFEQLKKILMQHGLVAFSMLGQTFDPSRAEALGFIEREGSKPGEVVEEVKKGFMLADRVLRPAQVIVIKEKLKDSKESIADSETDLFKEV